MSVKKVKILRYGEIQDAEIEIIRENRDGSRYTLLVIKFAGITCFASDQRSFFAFSDLRSKMDIIFKTKLLCMGAQVNVYPSGMQLTMETAYILTIGKPTSVKDIVGIYDDCIDINLIGTVEEQRKFRDEYFESIRPANWEDL